MNMADPIFGAAAEAYNRQVTVGQIQPRLLKKEVP